MMTWPLTSLVYFRTYCYVEIYQPRGIGDFNRPLHIYELQKDIYIIFLLFGNKSTESDNVLW